MLNGTSRDRLCFSLFGWKELKLYKEHIVQRRTNNVKREKSYGPVRPQRQIVRVGADSSSLSPPLKGGSARELSPSLQN